jgi:phosphatidate cytidylyltransferase
MTVLLVGLVVLDGWLDGSLTVETADDRPVRATVLMVLVAVVIGLGGLEFSRLAAAKGLVVLNPSCSIGLILLSTSWYWPQLIHIPQGVYVLSVVALALAGVLIQHHVRFGTVGVMANAGITCFSLMYLGLLPAFLLGIRIDAGLRWIVMFVLVVKAADIGAYTFGKTLGKHKFAPRVSPGKTWEGLAGAVLAAVVVSSLSAGVFGIMKVWLAVVFGMGTAVIGQLSDLAESMLKRDAQLKDSSNRVPGFGGILDIIDSPLFAAPFAYMFFRMVA